MGFHPPSPWAFCLAVTVAGPAPVIRAAEFPQTWVNTTGAIWRIIPGGTARPHAGALVFKDAAGRVVGTLEPAGTVLVLGSGTYQVELRSADPGADAFEFRMVDALGLWQAFTLTRKDKWVPQPLTGESARGGQGKVTVNDDFCTFSEPPWFDFDRTPGSFFRVDGSTLTFRYDQWGTAEAGIDRMIRNDSPVVWMFRTVNDPAAPDAGQIVFKNMDKDLVCGSVTEPGEPFEIRKQTNYRIRFLQPGAGRFSHHIQLTDPAGASYEYKVGTNPAGTTFIWEYLGNSAARPAADLNLGFDPGADGNLRITGTTLFRRGQPAGQGP